MSYITDILLWFVGFVLQTVVVYVIIVIFQIAVFFLLSQYLRKRGRDSSGVDGVAPWVIMFGLFQAPIISVGYEILKLFWNGIWGLF